MHFWLRGIVIKVLQPQLWYLDQQPRNILLPNAL